MADDRPSLHIDTDWKKQAQEEKKRLAEQEAERAAATAPKAAVPTAAPVPGVGGAGEGRRASARGGQREMPPASFPTLVQSLLTQTLYYLGELGGQGADGGVGLDMAKHQIDTLGIIEEKTKGNLTPDEQRILDAALYETRNRFVSIASQYT
jgi:hypothetical protein